MWTQLELDISLLLPPEPALIAAYSIIVVFLLHIVNILMYC